MDHDPKVWVTFEVVSAFLYLPVFEGRALSTLFQVFGYLGIAAASLLIVVRMYALPILCIPSLQAKISSIVSVLQFGTRIELP